MARYLWLIVNILACVGVNSAFEYKVSYVHDLIVNKNWTCYDVIELFLKRSYVYNPKLHAIINFNPRALADAVALDEFYSKNGKLKGKLHCVPVAVKDIIDIAGMPTTGGVRALRNSVPQKDATVIELLRAEGAVFVHKTNLFELAMQIESSEMGGECRNPYDLNRTAGGSSSGSAAAISAGLAIIALGSDTIGSILNPSAYNGIFGLRPPQNYIDMTGVFPLFNRHDTLGHMAKHVDDLVLAFTILATNRSFEYEDYLRPINSSQIRLGYSRILINSFKLASLNMAYYLEPGHKRLVDKSLIHLQELNFTLIELGLNLIDIVDMLTVVELNVYASMFTCLNSCRKNSTDAYFNNASRFATDAPYRNFEQFLNSPLLSGRWKSVLKVANVANASQTCESDCLVYDNFLNIFKRILSFWFESKSFDVFVLPAQLKSPYYVQKHSNYNDGIIYLFCTLSGYSCLNVPVGFTTPSDNPDGLPVGVIFISKPENMLKLFQTARLFEQHYGIDKMPYSTPDL